MDMRRRTVLTIVGGGGLSLAGCVGAPGGDEPGGTASLPGECPKTQGLDVEWPDELDPSAVESFVETYEDRYYREVVLGHDPESGLASYQLDTWIEDRATATTDGYELSVSGGGVYRPTLYLTARPADAPEGAEVVPAGEFEDEALNATLAEATETDEATLHVDEHVVRRTTTDGTDPRDGKLLECRTSN
jgi:hypothetical protein